ncbi:hypothetical protein I2485_06895 [Nesterenkonia sp. E16_7]|uniref:hypothetical protein n=1 Tax=unclassified Nesterenkonia TaxID=2629769 RepID=UPI001A92DEB7|nr:MULTISPECIES: hypothetical protein [unclassified Nesterenkonia]MBO0596602.1 hypothetical protein [Nesterenkonia sp. E16_10]MBO0598379.1 hypothetical protein [Nesterenkonia sp. E16_7]
MAENTTPNKGIGSPRARKGIYHGAAALLAIAAIYGFITAEEAEQYLQAAVLLLGTGGTELAASNTPKDPKVKGVTTEERPDLK